MCIVRVDGGAFDSEDFNRMRCANGQGGRELVCVCPPSGSLAFSGSDNPPFVPFPRPSPRLSYVCVGCASYG